TGAAGVALDAGGGVDAPGPDPGDGVGHVLGGQPAGEDEADAGGQLGDEVEVVGLAAAGARAVDHHDVDAVLAHTGEGGVAGGEGLDDHGDPHGGVARRLGGLATVELGTAQARLVHDLQHALGRRVAEHADGDRLRRHASHDVADEGGG